MRNDEKTGSKGRFIEKSPEESRLIFLIYTLRSDNPKISPKQILDKIMEFPDSWNTLKELIETRDKKKTESKIETLKKIQKLKKMSLSSDEDDSIDNTELEIEGLDINQLSQAKTPEEKAIKIIDACLRNESGYKYN